ncbi:MAG: hypothetical protein KDD22_08745, partial [Bdellovibrionales bacterium]|nr:hypothetical protein [Bdellovibrionales bacterium]
VRGDLDKALETLESASRNYGGHSEIQKRIRKILDLRSDGNIVPEPETSSSKEPPPNLQSQIRFLQELLQRVKSQQNIHSHKD